MGKICCQEEKERGEKKYIHASNEPVEKQGIKNIQNLSFLIIIHFSVYLSLFISSQFHDL